MRVLRSSDTNTIIESPSASSKVSRIDWDTKERWMSYGEWKEVGDLSLESMEDEEVSLVDGIFEGAFGALDDETWFLGAGVLV
ncbi:hypothetical protein Tco_0135045 [Tanacetum coccineum]